MPVPGGRGPLSPRTGEARRRPRAVCTPAHPRRTGSASRSGKGDARRRQAGVGPSYERRSEAPTGRPRLAGHPRPARRTRSLTIRKPIVGSRHKAVGSRRRNTPSLLPAAECRLPARLRASKRVSRARVRHSERSAAKSRDLSSPTAKERCFDFAQHDPEGMLGRVL